MRKLETAQAIHFRDLLREGRSAVLKDSEAFESIVRVIEQLGSLLAGKRIGLNNAASHLRDIAAASPLSSSLPHHFPALHLDFERLFHSVRRARNDAVHEGAYARRMADQVVELAIILEDALNRQVSTFAEVMVRNPVTAEPWHPVSLVRQVMLANSFSSLPLRIGEGAGVWHMVTDTALVRYLARPNRGHLLVCTIGDVVARAELVAPKATVVAPDAPVEHSRPSFDPMPVLVVSREGNLLGIVTAFDLL